MKTIVHTIIKLSIVILLLSVNDVKAHDSILHKIEKKTKEISNDKNNPDLYFERGHLHYLNNQFKESIKDYIKSEQLAFKNKLLHYRKSETYLALNDLKNASKCLTTYLKIKPASIEAHKLKSKILIEEKDFEEAKTTYKYILDNTKDIEPKDYINYATIILQINSKNYTGAINALDMGLQRLGQNMVNLQIKKLEYLKKQGDVKKVLDHYNIMIKNSTRKEFLYFKKANYLFENNDSLNASTALELCKVAVNALSSKYQNTGAIRKLKIQMQNLQNKL